MKLSAGGTVDLPVFIHRRVQFGYAASMLPASAELNTSSAVETAEAMRASREALRRSEAALREAGFVAHLTKPVTAGKLREEVRKIPVRK